MRKPYEIYSKYRSLQKKYLERDILEKIKMCHTNCKYNATVELSGAPVKMCMFGQHTPSEGMALDVSKLIVCSTDHQALQCNAYVPKFPHRIDAENKLKEELSDPRVKRERYPDIVALEWVMDNELHQLKKNPPSWKHRVVFWLINKLENMARDFYKQLSTISQQEIEK
jgi:hypothetical protein